MGKIKVYLADLVHNYLGGGSYMFPLNVGFVASYARKIFGDYIDIEIFKYPDHLIKRLKEDLPDILGLGHYSWNAHLNNRVSGLAKSLSSGTLIVCGGPNINQTEGGYRDFFAENKAVDFYAINEGETSFINLIRQYLNVDCDLSRTKDTAIDGCIFLRNKDIVIGERPDRIDDLNSIPSPYLTGMLNEFFEYDLIPIVETNRGCPFSCTYCAQGLVSQHRVKLFDIDRVLEELDYIAGHVKKTNLLCFADANFGIVPRDIRIGEKIHALQTEKDYPRRCVINWVKTRQSIALAEIMGESAYLVSSLQSVDPVVLKNIKRNNIENDHFREIIDHVNEAGGISGTEIILALPGETKESHLNSLRMIFGWNVSYIICYNCLLINGSELTLPEEREKYRIKTKFRLIDSSFSQYDDMLSFESEEGIRFTSTMSEEDILFFRPVHWLIQFFWNYRAYFPLLKYLHLHDVNPVDFTVSVIESAKDATGPVRSIFQDFREESINEWFPTAEALREYYGRPENFEFIRAGGVGKMNGKYTWKVILECKRDFDAYIGEVAKRMLPRHENILDDLINFSANTLPDFSGEIDFGRRKLVNFHYDIFEWQKGKFKSPIRRRDVSYLFYFTDEKKDALNLLINQYRHTNRNVTMRKMTEHMRITDLYYDIEEVKNKL
ncbi:MAG: radical SAM protein [Proteobacteria bacterium]|nr:radical SAM protein [Pseudomonadota bacterium]